jgi:hypothetical protein
LQSYFSVGAFNVGVDDGTVGVKSTKIKVGVKDGTSVGVLVMVGDGVNVG